MRLKIKSVFFFIILTVGISVRIFHLSSIPASLHVDEASIGYNAYSIVTSGRDEYGKPYPVFFKAFGEYKSPIQIYSTVPFIFLFGLNEFSVRFTSVLYGVFGLIAIYLLAKELWKHDTYAEIIALLSMFFLAISPWDIHFSRIAWEMMPFVFFTTFGMYLFLKAQVRPLLLLLAIPSFIFAFYSYFAAQLFIPVFGIGLFVLYFRFFLSHKKETFISFLVLFAFMIPFFYHLLSPAELHRWQDVSVFSHPPKNQSVQQRITENYLKHFSLDFLFLKGDIGMPGQRSTYDAVRGMGELYLFQLPWLLIGLYYSVKKRSKGLVALLLWLILYPMGSIFTDNANPLSRRSVIGVIPFQVLSAAGMIYFFQMISGAMRLTRISFVTSALIIGFSFYYYLSLYFGSYIYYSSDFFGFQYGMKPIVSYFSSHQSSYDDLVMSPYVFSPYIHFKFYAPHDCQKCLTGFPEALYVKGRRQLYALPPYYMASHNDFLYISVKKVYYPNGSVAFDLVRVGKRY